MVMMGGAQGTGVSNSLQQFLLSQILFWYVGLLSGTQRNVNRVFIQE